MSRTTNLRRQHDGAVALVGQILVKAELLEQRGVPYEVSMLLAKLTGMLRIHFVQEDRSLYPYMRMSAHPKAAAVAAAFEEEMGGLATQFEKFVSRWQSATSLAANPAEFRGEAAAIFEALSKRIQRENEQLYPLAEAIHEGQVARSA